MEMGRLREKYELSNVAVSNFCSVSERTIRRWLDGTNLPSDNQLIKISDGIERISKKYEKSTSKYEPRLRTRIALYTQVKIKK